MSKLAVDHADLRAMHHMHWTTPSAALMSSSPPSPSELAWCRLHIAEQRGRLILELLRSRCGFGLIREQGLFQQVALDLALNSGIHVRGEPREPTRSRILHHRFSPQSALRRFGRAET